MFNNFVQYFHKGPITFHNTFFFIFDFFCSNRVLLDTSKKLSNFNIFSILSLSKFEVLNKVHESFMTCKCDAMYMKIVSRKVVAYNIRN
jgi:hypothetical protein